MPLSNNLTPNAATWTANVPQLETTTLALGGPGGPMNEQAQALLDRTEWLYNNLSRATKGVVELTTSTTLVAAGMNKAYFIDGTVTTQIGVELPSGAACEDGDAIMFKHTAGGSGSMEITCNSTDDFLPASGSWFILTPGDFVIFVLKKGAAGASKWLPVASYNYIAPTPSAWATTAIPQGNVTPAGGPTIASGYSGNIRWKKDATENILHFKLSLTFLASANGVTGLAVDLSNVFTTPAAGFYVHLGTGQCSGFPVQTYINASSEILNVLSIAGQTLDQGGSFLVLLEAHGHVEVNP